ncbi:phosphoadenosine phosphosulfate reductase [Lentibacillus halodurans]|uniref:Adenosine 5'-phosphosulfate reductase n=1 Tax=Lentibacillus halodurans TaxID=237679 RepID=A0A1I0W9K9_9BACI|nr:phosphoadenylyl-sulfate reductase [Lentibacillus halodurans]SFA84910.1 phosphoadenosine phosphosulfate reductase [Lentibacillus halodurans]
MGDRLTYDNWDEHDHERLNNTLTDFMDVIKWAFQEYQDKIVYACSFGAEGMVLLDLISKVNPQATIVFLDTGLHFKETYALIDKVKQHYPKLHIKMAEPVLTVEQQAAEYGDKLWERHPNLCCHMRKIEPLQQELASADAWLSGLRREQSVSRQNTAYINQDDKFKRIKICPLIHWTWDDVWRYINLNNLPYNTLHDNHYPSIGCEMCTLPVKNETDIRSGRWANFAKQECGLHQT